MTDKPTRGGARAGSGRKRRTVPRVAITVRLEHYDAERFRALCRAAGCSQADWIARALNGSSMTFTEWHKSAAKCYDRAMMELASNFQPNDQREGPP